MPFEQTAHFSRRSINFFMIISLFILSSIVFSFKSKDIDLKIAYNGFGPHDYVNQKIYPDNFVKNWPNGILIYDYSLIMRAYYYLSKYFNLEVSTIVYPFMFMQILLFFFSVFILTEALFKNKLVAWLSMFIVSVGALSGLNLARFGSGFASLLNFCLYYGYANAFRIFALALFLKQRYLLSFIFLGLAVYCHVNMGLFMFVFIFAYLFYKPKLICNKEFLSGFILFLVIVLPYLINLIVQASSFASEIPLNKWILITKIFSHHWYPITMGLFTKSPCVEAFPVLLLSFLFFLSFRYQDIHSQINKKIISGIAACFLMLLVGILFSEIWPIPFLIKISFHRATSIITFLGVLYIINYLVCKIIEGGVLNIVVAIFALMTMVWSKPGIATLPFLILLYTDIKEGYFGPIKVKRLFLPKVKFLYWCLSGFVIFLVLLPFFLHHLSPQLRDGFMNFLWSPFHYFNPMRNPDFFLRGGTLKFSILDGRFIYFALCFLLISFGVCLYKPNAQKYLRITKQLGFLGIFVISTSLVFILTQSEYLSWKESTKDVAQAYLDVQRWAKKFSAKDALFMIDPSHSYGWRDFSQRSSFGSIREWGYVTICYNSNYKNYLEGVKRMREFGINIDKLTIEDIEINREFLYGTKLIKDAQTAYYSMSEQRMRELVNKYDINYFLFDKRFKNKSFPFKRFEVVYENNYYFVCKSGLQ